MAVCPESVNRYLHEITKVWQRGGWVGVDLFFVLSGFLIASLLFNEHQRYGAISFGKFFVRRGLKIYPPFFVMIAVTVLYVTVSGKSIPVGRLVRELTFLQNYGGGLWDHTWSLAIEEHFYLLLPLALIASQRMRSTGFAWISKAFVVVALTCFALRVWTALLWPYSHEMHLFPTHLRVDSLFCGVAVAHAYHHHHDLFRSISDRHRRLLAILGAACFIPPFAVSLPDHPLMYTVVPAVLWAGGAMLLVAFVPVEPQNRAVDGIAFIGARSYSIYLWHLPVAAWGIAVPMFLFFEQVNWYFYAFLYIGGSLLAGSIMAAMIELPVLRLRDRLIPSRSKALA